MSMMSAKPADHRTPRGVSDSYSADGLERARLRPRPFLRERRAPPLPRRQVVHNPLADAPAHQPERWVTDRGGNAAHLAVAGIAMFGANSSAPVALPPLWGIEAAALIVLYPFVGLENSLVPASETRQAARTIPRALIVLARQPRRSTSLCSWLTWRPCPRGRHPRRRWPLSRSCSSDRRACSFARNRSAPVRVVSRRLEP